MNHSRVAFAASCVLALLPWDGRAADSPAAGVPAQQQALLQTGTGGPEMVKLQTIPVLQPGPRQVLIRVHAAALNPTDLITLRRPAPAGQTVRRVLGIDVAGVIVAAGPDTAGRPVGMPVFGIIDRQDPALNGAYAQYALLRAASSVPKPPNLSYAEAAGLGVVGVTALRMLDNAKVSAGQRVLVTGVAGGVGSTAAQMARARGAIVVGTASPRHAQYLQSIGVSEVIDYRQGRVADKAGKVDAIVDTVGGEEAVDLLRALKSGGYFTSAAGAPVKPEQCAALRVQCLGSPGSAAAAPLEVLEQVGQLAAAGKLRINIDESYPLERGAEGLTYLDEGHAEGKVVLAVSGEANKR
jgi:NADPH:quinone reductase-like Zn-dependent oxidoreductase